MGDFQVATGGGFWVATRDPGGIAGSDLRVHGYILLIVDILSSERSNIPASIDLSRNTGSYGISPRASGSIFVLLRAIDYKIVLP